MSDTRTDTTMPRSALDELREDPTSRKRFLRLAGGGATATALSALIAACGGDDKGSSSTAATTSAATATGTTGSMSGDIAIVNYALTLEYLEADFYKQVIASGAITDRKAADLAKKFGDTEQQHVEVLEGTVRKLGGTPVSAPKTAFDDVLAGGPKKILETAATVENLGAAAYLGQAGRIKSKDILAAALSIHSVEARHAAALNELVGRGFKGDGPLSGSLPDGAFAHAMSMDEVLAAVKPFVAA